jgi:hypothetical protein
MLSRLIIDRLKYGTQEIVIFRANLLIKMQRHCAIPPQITHGPLTRQLAQTLLAQGHLAPIPLHCQPVFWEYDHALRLYRTPDVVSDMDFYSKVFLLMLYSLFYVMMYYPIIPHLKIAIVSILDHSVIHSPGIHIN